MQEITPPYDATVFIGRFQPIHHGHLKTIRIALKNSKILIIIIGSYKSAPSTRVPWNAKQRIEMIKKCLSKEEKKRIFFIPIRDRIYSDTAWNQNIINETLKRTGSVKKISLIGHNKDKTSYYLKNFPDWHFYETGNFENINSTDFRKIYFSNNKPDYKFIPKQIKNWLIRYRKTIQFRKIKKEYLFVEKAKKNLTQDSFTVANCLIICGNYILLVQRKNFPGKNLYALPGGHLETNEDPEAGAIRELYEETQIALDSIKLKESFVEKGYFDYPERNPITRYYAHVFFYRLNYIECPNVTAGDDAQKANWYLLDDLYFMEDQFFSDHYQIIQILLGRITK